ncbi:unnamed protein product [Moneuplotes crassus]|uniref:Uncharacterized protein n=1 Tax=Euplotes crassus TaxID=5936 RepID=A0AAD1U9G5_EUPCR|nr:unnamed protein product [Moneuplotes crassus]
MKSRQSHSRVKELEKIYSSEQRMRKSFSNSFRYQRSQGADNQANNILPISNVKNLNSSKGLGKVKKVQSPIKSSDKGSESPQKSLSSILKSLTKLSIIPKKRNQKGYLYESRKFIGSKKHSKIKVKSITNYDPRCKYRREKNNVKTSFPQAMKSLIKNTKTSDYKEWKDKSSCVIQKNTLNPDSSLNKSEKGNDDLLKINSCLGNKSIINLSVSDYQ